LGKSVHLNRPGKKHNSGFGLPLIAVTKIKKISFLKNNTCRNIVSNTGTFQ